MREEDTTSEVGQHIAMAASSSDFLHGADLEAEKKWTEARQGYDLQSDSQWFLCPSHVSQLSRTVPPTGDQVLKIQVCEEDV